MPSEHVQMFNIADPLILKFKRFVIAERAITKICLIIFILTNIYLTMYFNKMHMFAFNPAPRTKIQSCSGELKVHTVGAFMTPWKRFMTPLVVMV